jgi:hypothetical protein
MATSKQDLVDGLIAARSRHADRSRGARIAQTAAGLVLLAVALPLSIVVAELGVPGLLFALRLLADEYDWAARAYATIAWRWERFRVWFAARSGAVKALVLLATSVVALVIVALLA